VREYSTDCTVLYCTVLYCTVLYSTVLYSAVLYCTVLHSTGLDRTGLHLDGSILCTHFEDCIIILYYIIVLYYNIILYHIITLFLCCAPCGAWQSRCSRSASPSLSASRGPGARPSSAYRRRPLLQMGMATWKTDDDDIALQARARFWQWTLHASDVSQVLKREGEGVWRGGRKGVIRSSGRRGGWCMELQCV